MAKKKTQAALPEDIDIARAIASYFKMLPPPEVKIMRTTNSVGFYLMQHAWAHFLLSILTHKHGDSAFELFVEVLAELGFVESK